MRLDLLFEVLVRRGDDAACERDALGCADARDGFVLKHPQQHRLLLERHFADFVKEYRAAAGKLKFALVAALFSPRERAFRVAEQLAHNQVLRDGGAVDSHIRAVRAAGSVVYRLGDEVLARAALAGDEHAALGCGSRACDFN
ncbi:hypothetical protein SDC9_169279 [bioreactor metagenome]|uniref:Uncharacterized protein n=1 Tax=bioreactor metagenome TaxID=1076179 RepID=A0A645G4R9_9ZZZZ